MKKSEAKRRVLIADIVAVHGIRGDVVLRAYTGDPFDVAKYGVLYSENDDRTFAVGNVRVVGQRVVARIAGVDDRTSAETLRGTKLYAEREKFAPPKDGEFYHVDLIGVEAVSEAGDVVGRVIAVKNFGAGDMLEVKPGGTGGPTLFVPFTKAHVPDVRLDEGKVIVVLPRYADADRHDEDESV